MLDPVETGLLHTALVVFVSHLPVGKGKGMGKKLHGEVQLPVLSEMKILIIHDRPILFLFWFHCFSSIDHFW